MLRQSPTSITLGASAEAEGAGVSLADSSGRADDAEAGGVARDEVVSPANGWAGAVSGPESGVVHPARIKAVAMPIVTKAPELARGSSERFVQPSSPRLL
ncbi:hypothetical protein [Demequina aurantiaca]|uniref:hypothetical protein n=1 Tax=Demequina aurantiaca TaxID=676200 RepID=UPI001F47C553|nr:hypothetical protein [Demequina aurantiaca]